MSRRTHLAIITEARDFAASRDFDSDGNMSTSILRYYLDLLDVAHRHEVQNALDAGGFVEASRKNKQVGNAAKLREALKKIDKIVWDKKRHTKGETEAHRIATEVLTAVHSTSPEPIGGDAAKLREALKLCLRGMCGYCRMDAEARGMTTECVNRCEVMLDAKAALAAPPRNCDAMDWRTAWKIWREKFHPETPVGYSAVVKGTEAFMDWFTAPATEQEGGAR